MTSDSDIAAVDWRGQAVDCKRCSQKPLLAKGKCQRGHACVEDRYAKRIVRFFDWNPELADDFLGHAHFEVRAIAAQYANPFRLPPLLEDEDEAVRWNAASRLPKSYQRRLIADPDREVRIRIATRLDDADLVRMMFDTDAYVRLVVARRIGTDKLLPMIEDEDPAVRRIVAARIDGKYLARMALDPDALVRLEILGRLPDEDVGRMKDDPDWRVRHAVACRADLSVVRGMLGDADPLVAEICAERLAAAARHERKAAS